MPASVSVIIPCLNEEEPIADVVKECLATGIPKEILVVDNGSTDRTAAANSCKESMIYAPKSGSAVVSIQIAQR